VSVRRSGSGIRAGWNLAFLAVLAVVGLSALAAGQSVQVAPENQIATDKKMQLETAVSHFMAANAVPGVSIAVVENGVEDWSEGFGSADLENFVPATPFTLFRLGSISKPITATAALLLWQQGKLDLDASVQTYCPAFPEKQWPITTRELLGHLGGIRHYKSETQGDLEGGNTKHFTNQIQAGLDFFKNDPLVAKPGTEFHYSTQGYTLVGCAIEGASGQKYVDYVREHVLLPARMKHTTNDDRFAIIPYRTRFYTRDEDGAIRNADFLDSSYKIPGGGWLSSADDMAQFEVAMLNDRIVTRSTRDLMWTSMKAADGKETGYGMGWGVGNGSGLPDVGHSGGQQGTSTYFLIVPERRAGIVVLINDDKADSSALGIGLMKIVLGATAPDNNRAPAPKK
jgi:serine beta-lactamase-like protein LACTB, mitochondrial